MRRLGAIAKAIATELTRVDIHAVELSEEAAGYAARNLADTLVQLHIEDMADCLPELDSTVDLVIANPPYIPLEAYAPWPPRRGIMTRRWPCSQDRTGWTPSGS